MRLWPSMPFWTNNVFLTLIKMEEYIPYRSRNNYMRIQWKKMDNNVR